MLITSNTANIITSPAIVTNNDDLVHVGHPADVAVDNLGKNGVTGAVSTDYLSHIPYLLEQQEVLVIPQPAVSSDEASTIVEVPS